ncbi:uncharacterized protein [Amphiura filiformis]|uniref:uncharacterized protein isoform X2 n=1 Tax=Amphiura filiformis TaxID=82378 RepID=UPI003B21F1EC
MNWITNSSFATKMKLSTSRQQATENSTCKRWYHLPPQTVQESKSTCTSRSQKANGDELDHKLLIRHEIEAFYKWTTSYRKLACCQEVLTANM